METFDKLKVIKKEVQTYFEENKWNKHRQNEYRLKNIGGKC